MLIRLAGLPPGPQTFEYRCSAGEYLDDTDTFPGDINIRATVEREGNSLRLTLETELLGHFICDRCGKAFQRNHRSRSDFFYVFEEIVGGTSIADEVAVIPRDAISLNVSQEIRDQVILGMPLKFLCREDCRGLCPMCGADLNVRECNCQKKTIDPRWEALQKLKTKKRNHK